MHICFGKIVINCCKDGFMAIFYLLMIVFLVEGISFMRKPYIKT